MKKGISLLFALYLIASYVHIVHATSLERRCEELKLLHETMEFAEFIVE